MRFLLSFLLLFILKMSSSPYHELNRTNSRSIASSRSILSCLTQIAKNAQKPNEHHSEEYLKLQKEFWSTKKESIDIFFEEKGGKLVPLPERETVHTTIVEPQVLPDIHAVSNGIDNSPARKRIGKPVLLLTRGNSGSGKSYTLKNSTLKLFDELNIKQLVKDHPDGAINPDNFKRVLQNEVGKGNVTSSMIHEEGSLLAKKAIKTLFEEQKSFIIDKRFGTQESLEKVTKIAQENNYHVIVVDADADVLVSSHRIADRVTGGESPNLHFKPVIDGFVESRMHRKAISLSPTVDEYYSFSQGDLVSRRLGKTQELELLNQSIWNKISSVPDNIELSKAENLYGDLLNRMSETTVQDFLQVKKNMNPHFQPEWRRLETDPEGLSRSETYYKNAIHEYLTQALRYQEDRAHENLVFYIGEYLKHIIPDLDVEIRLIKGSHAELNVNSTNKQAMQWLIDKRQFKFQPISQGDQPSIKLKLSTKDLTKRDGFNVVERSDIGNLLELDEWNVQTTSIAHNFITNQNQQNKIASSPPIFDFSSKGKLKFSKPEDFKDFMYGFRSDTIQAYTFSGQVGLNLLKKVAIGSNESIALLKQIKADLNSAREFSAMAKFMFENPQFGFKFGNASKQDIQKTRQWISKNEEVLKTLEEALSKLDTK